MSSTAHIHTARRNAHPIIEHPAGYPVAVAAVAFVWFLIEVAARLWGHADAWQAIGLKPFVLLVVAAVAAGLAWRARAKARKTARQVAADETVHHLPPRRGVTDGGTGLPAEHPRHDPRAEAGQAPLVADGGSFRPQRRAG